MVPVIRLFGVDPGPVVNIKWDAWTLVFFHKFHQNFELAFKEICYRPLKKGEALLWLNNSNYSVFIPFVSFRSVCKKNTCWMLKNPLTFTICDTSLDLIDSQLPSFLPFINTNTKSVWILMRTIHKYPGLHCVDNGQDRARLGKLHKGGLTSQTIFC